MAINGLNQITAESAEQGEPLAFPERRPSASDDPTFTVSCVVNGFPVTVTFTGKARKLMATIDRLRELGAEAPGGPQREQEYTPDGLPICRKHGAPMKKREKQGETWHSHAAGDDAQGNPIYCKGYQGKDSPGWEL